MAAIVCSGHDTPPLTRMSTQGMVRRSLARPDCGHHRLSRWRRDADRARANRDDRADHAACGPVGALADIVHRRRLLQFGQVGSLVGALGAGAVGGATVLPRLQRELGMNLVLTAASILFAAGSAALALVRSPAIVFVLMLVAGVGWVGVLATLSIVTRTVLPAWVRARATGVYLVVFSGGQAIGALIWGERRPIRRCDVPRPTVAAADRRRTLDPVSGRSGANPTGRDLPDGLMGRARASAPRAPHCQRPRAGAGRSCPRCRTADHQSSLHPIRNAWASRHRARQ